MSDWKMTEVNFLKANKDKMSRHEIAKALGRSYFSVNGKFKSLGFVSKNTHKWTKADEQFVLEHWKTHSDLEIAKLMDLNRDQIKARRHKMGLIKSKELQKVTRSKNCKPRITKPAFARKGGFMKWVLEGNV